MFVWLKEFLNINFPVAMTKYYYRRIMHKSLNLNNPITFNEKINWLKLYYWPQLEISKILADKYKVRNYVASKGLEHILNKLIGCWAQAEDIEWEFLPEKFVLKCNHGCGMNIICHDKKFFDTVMAERKLEKWLKMDWGKYACEPHYSAIEPVIIAEEFIGNTIDNSLPDDIKVHCFGGKPCVIGYYTNRESELCCTLYDTSWKKLDISIKEGIVVECPKCLQKILEYCEVLTEGLPYARCDFYVCNEEVIFGEITLTPASGRSKFIIEEADYHWGTLLNIDNLK